MSEGRPLEDTPPEHSPGASPAEPLDNPVDDAETTLPGPDADTSVPQDTPSSGGGTAGAGFQPPPLTAYAWRTGLVRPARGRLVAGVCGALGRATNTDPVLWRVVLAVLSVFGGLGVVAYLIGWLMLPAEGDTASPIEALLVRGHSNTSVTVTVIVSMIVLVSVGAFAFEPFRPGLVAAALLCGVVLLLLRDQRGRRANGMPVGPTQVPTEQPTSPGPAGPGWAPAPGWHGGGPGWHAGPGWRPAAGPPWRPGPVGPGGPPYVPPAGWRPAPLRRRRRSQLGLLTMSIVLLAVGGLFAAELSGFAVPPTAYPATALGVVGLGLIVGAWFGRARGLIAAGILLSLVLGATTVVGDGIRSGWHTTGSITWTVTTVDGIQRTYRHGVGDARLDLSQVDFAGRNVTIDVSLDLGNLDITLPRTVDATVRANVHIGNTTVFGQSEGGIGSNTRTVTDNGPDGPGGGTVTIVAKINIGNLEVHR
jgi:phage shock protein PspC (stress-responsive transcriptional regulator)